MRPHALCRWPAGQSVSEPHRPPLVAWYRSVARHVVHEAGASGIRVVASIGLAGQRASFRLPHHHDRIQHLKHGEGSERNRPDFVFAANHPPGG